MQVCSLLLEHAVCSFSDNRAIYKVYWPYSWFYKTQDVPLYGEAVAQLGGRLEKLQITWHRSLLLHCQGVHLHQAADNHTVLISLFPRHRVTLLDTKPCQLENRSLLLNFWAFHKQHCKCAMLLCFKSDHSGPQILCTYDKCQCNFWSHWQFHR